MTQAAYFHNGIFQKHAGLSEAAATLQACADAATSARCVETGHASVHKAVRDPALVAPLVAAAAAIAMRIFQWPLPESFSLPLDVLASLHIPMAMIALGGVLERWSIPRRHAFVVRTVLTARLISGLLVSIFVLGFSPDRLMYTMRSAAMAVCLLAPISYEVCCTYQASLLAGASNMTHASAYTH
jgi:predicted permease